MKLNEFFVEKAREGYFFKFHFEPESDLLMVNVATNDICPKVNAGMIDASYLVDEEQMIEMLQRLVDGVEGEDNG